MIKLTNNCLAVCVRPEDICKIITCGTGSQISLAVHGQRMDHFFVDQAPDEVLRLIQQENEVWRAGLRSSFEEPKND